MIIGNAIADSISMMTEEEFWDKFNKKHNPQFYEKLKKKKTEKNKTTDRKIGTSEGHPIFKVSD